MNVLRGIKDSMATAADASLQKLGHVLLAVRDFRNNPDVFHKTCQLGFSLLLGLNLYKGGNYFPKFSVVVFNTYSMHNFSGVLKIPYLWFYPISVDGINEFNLVKALVGPLKVAAKKDGKNPKTAKEEGQKLVSDFLEGMKRENKRFKSFKDFKEALQARVKDQFPSIDLSNLHDHNEKRIVKNVYTTSLGKLLYTQIKNSTGGNLFNDQAGANEAAQKYINELLKAKTYCCFDKFKRDLQAKIRHDHSVVNLSDLTEKRGIRLAIVKPSSFLERITNLFFDVTDIICFPLYLQEWKLDPIPTLYGWVEKAGLGAQAQALGQFKVFQWIRTTDLGDWAWMAASGGFAFELLNSLRQLHDDALTAAKRSNLRWSAFEAFVELIYCQVALHLKHDSVKPYVIACAIVAKSVGLLKIAFRKPIKLFDPAAAAA